MKQRSIYHDWPDQDLLQEADENCVGLNQWEIAFVDSLFKRMVEGSDITIKQRKLLIKLLEEKCP